MKFLVLTNTQVQAHIKPETQHLKMWTCIYTNLDQALLFKENYLTNLDEIESSFEGSLYDPSGNEEEEKKS